MDRPRDLDLHADAALPTFLVERYWPGVDLTTLRARLPGLEAAARAMTEDGTSVVHLASILMPVDEVVFSLIAARDEAAVRAAVARADIPFDRIAAAITLLPGRVPDRAGGPMS